MTDKTKRKSPEKKGHYGRYSKEQKLAAMELLCMELVASNSGVQTICDSIPELPEARTIWQWLFKEIIDTTDKEKPINQLYAQAKAQQMTKMADDTLSIADDQSRDTDPITGKYNMAAVQRDRLRADTRKWLLSKLDRRTYGDKSEVTVKDDSNVSLTEMMRQAQNRVSNGIGDNENAAHSAAQGVDSGADSEKRTH